MSEIKLRNNSINLNFQDKLFLSFVLPDFIFRLITKAVGRVRSACQRRRLQLTMLRIPGDQNVLADALSRAEAMPGEWELTPRDWLRISNWVPGQLNS